ncbi:MAG: winged helix-turn-helix domain-containing protein [Acidobacteria bacterium]|nr:winged helix-turn-helix domain-containing protein [Acidobacteriota bacterium]
MARELQIGGWLVEPDLNCITRGKKKIPVEPKVIEVLVCLADDPGEVLSKEQIIQTVWPDTYVSEEVLRYSISELRKAFKDDAKNPRVIQTIARRGYRLIAPVTKKDPFSQAKASVAVLAFSDMSALKDQEYFCDGISEEVINNLTRINKLRVASRTSSFAFKGRAEDIRSIGKRLNVSAVLEGSVRKAEDRLRISVQLINVKDGYPLWSEQYDRELKNIFAIQDEIARRIAATLKITLSPRESDAISKTPTTDLRAYDFYLRGRQFYYQYTRRGIEFALKLFSQAIELDKDFARAYAGIADCCSYLFMYGGNQNKHLKQADSNSLKALEMDPDSAEAHASRGVALFLREEFVESEKEFETAIRLDPMLFEAYYFYARSSFVQGELEKAVRLYEKSSEVNPHDYQAPLLVAQIYSDLGQPQKAEASRRRGIEVAEARLKLNPDDARALYMGANGLVALGEIDRGVEWAGLALEMDPSEPMVLYNVACIQSLAGLSEDAISSLETAFKNGLSQEGWIDQDSNLDPLRSHPRFKRLIKQIWKQAGSQDLKN